MSCVSTIYFITPFKFGVYGFVNIGEHMDVLESERLQMIQLFDPRKKKKKKDDEDFQLSGEENGKDADEDDLDDLDDELDEMDDDDEDGEKDKSGEEMSEDSDFEKKKKKKKKKKAESDAEIDSDDKPKKGKGKRKRKRIKAPSSSDSETADSDAPKPEKKKRKKKKGEEESEEEVRDIYRSRIFAPQKYILILHCYILPECETKRYQCWCLKFDINSFDTDNIKLHESFVTFQGLKDCFNVPD